LSLLPAAAQAVLSGKDRAYEIRNDGRDTALWLCSEVTTDEARALAEIFSEAGYERSTGPGPWDDTHFRTPAPIHVLIGFEPILPHGQWEQFGG
jgi:hypothetical protein